MGCPGDVDGARGNPTRGVKIVFAGSDGEARTLYYFSTNLADDGVKSSKFLNFCETLAPEVWITVGRTRRGEALDEQYSVYDRLMIGGHTV